MRECLWHRIKASKGKRDEKSSFFHSSVPLFTGRIWRKAVNKATRALKVSETGRNYL